MATKRDRLHTRRIEAVGYDRARGEVSVRFDDGDLARATLGALRVPATQPIAGIAIDELGHGIEITYADGSMHDVAADFFTWLVRPDYAALYPSDDALGKRIGAQVVELRRDRNLSQAALAQLAGMEAPNLSRLEKGRHVPTLDVLLRIAKALGVPLPVLFTPPPPRRGAPVRKANRRASSRRRAGER